MNEIDTIRECYRERDDKTYAYTVIHKDHEQARKDVRSLLRHIDALTAERAKVVAWLRDRADKGDKSFETNKINRHLHPSATAAIDAMRSIADAIERGEHDGGT